MLGMREWISSIGSGQPLCHIEHSIWPKLPLCKLPSTEHHGVQRCIPDVACRYEVNNPRGCPESLYSSLTALRKDSRTLAKESNVVAAAMCEAGGLRKRTASPHCVASSACHSCPLNTCSCLPVHLIALPILRRLPNRIPASLKPYCLISHY